MSLLFLRGIISFLRVWGCGFEADDSVVTVYDNWTRRVKVDYATYSTYPSLQESFCPIF
jgi:hypothetical protein